MIQIPDFKDKSELFKWLKLNKHLIITEKKAQLKRADPVVFQNFRETNVGTIEKSEPNPDLLKLTEFNVKVVINTTNIRDSHKDVHIPGLWKKSLSERKLRYLLQEHEMKFDHIISDRVTAYTKTISWKELGFDFQGTTEALIFDAAIEKARNEYMAEQYAKGYVKNHSVGMQYVKIEMAINSESKYDTEEKAVWDKYINQIANKAEVEDDGYFWAVTEAKEVEGSAVPMGSNYATPTISVGKFQEPDPSTLNEPSLTLGKEIDFEKVAQAIKSL